MLWLDDEPDQAESFARSGGSELLAGQVGISVDPATAAYVMRSAAIDHGRELRALRTARARRLAIALGLARGGRAE